MNINADNVYYGKFPDAKLKEFHQRYSWMNDGETVVDNAELPADEYARLYEDAPSNPPRHTKFKKSG